MNTLNTATSLITKARGAPPVPAFPTVQASVPGIGTYNYVSMDGPNCVFATRGEIPAGSPYSYLYWSNDFGATLIRATIGGSVQKFFGCVAISGQNVIAMGSVGTQNATPNYYLSTNAGQSYTVTSISPGVAAVGPVNEPYISMDGSNAIWASYYHAPRYSSNAGASWTASTGGTTFVSDVKIYGNNAYFGTYGANGFYYSTNKGQSFTKNATVTRGKCITKCGSNLYIAGSGNIYKSTNNGVTASIIMTQALGDPASITSFPGTNGHFVWFGIDGNSSNYYTNNADSSGTVTWTTVANGARTPNTSAANSTRMLAGSGYGEALAGIFWGRNAYIT